MRKAGHCRHGGCKKQGVASFDDLCVFHVKEYRSKALLAWHEAIRALGSNCENRPDEFTQTKGVPKPSREQAEVLCFGCPVRAECSRVKSLKFMLDGVILDGEAVGSWEEL